MYFCGILSFVILFRSFSFIWISLARDLSILFFSKNEILVSICSIGFFLFVLVCFSLFYFCSDLYYFLPSTGSWCFYFPLALSFVWDSSSWGRPVLLETSLLEGLLLHPKDFGPLFSLSFVFYFFFNLLTHSLLSSTLFNFHVFSFQIFLWLISSFIVLCSEKMHGMISVSFVFVVLWPNMWSILEYVPCVLEKNVYSVLGQNILNIYIR